ncbi:5-oxoprolinase subunit PxpB [Hymenobacter latericus]|uniref:5-oxoprolinase subunit PxpB n=1 Tax=Hymenobacter sp. YIM 151858-1 TaxID=2987688 RepID=UPI002225BCB4|nr:5-oxoprolinase subunit PxpB [Hymenobacter sp. YIM 151858-1]UYZ59690.1 5-oxoprolinase subunit PxpB [Hymenobacter sp. YIM 151858-1]
MQPAVQLYPLGDAAVVVEFGNSISPVTHETVQAFCQLLEQQPFAGLVEYVPAFTTVTVYYDPWLLRQQAATPYDAVLQQLEQLLRSANTTAAPPAHRLVEIPVCYGGQHGPDLGWLADYKHLAPEQVVALHAAPEYLVYMIGFAPGFPYLGGLDEQLTAPRKEQPRPLVPAGTVGIAGKQTGVYPLATPGGWQLIGRTPLRLFRPEAEVPSLLQAGDRVRFVPISDSEYQRLQQHEL